MLKRGRPAAVRVQAHAPTSRAGRTYERFNIHQRVQHFLLAFSFLGLVATGLPMRFSELAISQRFVALLSGVTVVGNIHRALGVMMIAAAVYHIGYLIVMYRRGYRGTPALFSRTDWPEFIADVKYCLGLVRQRPRFARYSWYEKFDYFGAAVGVLLMVGTGLIMWFPELVTRLLPGWVVTTAVIVHDYEACLALLAIFIGHFYWVHLHPDVYPMSMVWLTGRLSEEEMARHHPRELAEWQNRERPVGGNDEVRR